MATILIVEDEILLRLALADALTECGHVVIECGSILESVAVLAGRQQIDAVVTDVDLPGGLSGLDLARLMTTARPSVPVWVVSGRDVDVTDLGNVVAFLPKPYGLNDLANRVTNQLLATVSGKQLAVGSRRSFSR